MATTPPPSSHQARLTIRDAFDAPEDGRRFQATTLQDVHDAAITVADSKSLRNLRRIEPFLIGLGRYAKGVEVLCNGTDYLPWIWAPVKLMPLLSSDYISSLEKLLDAYSQICDTLPRFDRLSIAFKNDANFQTLLAVFYADILDFHRRAYTFSTRGGSSPLITFESSRNSPINPNFSAWKRFFDTSWTGFGRRFKSILESLAINAELVDKEATATDPAEAKAWRDQQKRSIASFEKER